MLFFHLMKSMEHHTFNMRRQISSRKPVFSYFALNLFLQWVKISALCWRWDEIVMWTMGIQCPSKKVFNTLIKTIHSPNLFAMTMTLSRYLDLWHIGFPINSSLQMYLQQVNRWASSFMSCKLLSLAMNCVRCRRHPRSLILSKLLPDTLRTWTHCCNIRKGFLCLHQIQINTILFKTCACFKVLI